MWCINCSTYPEADRSMTSEWLNQQLFTITARELALSAALLGIAAGFFVRWIGRLRASHREQQAQIQSQLRREAVLTNLGDKLNAATSPRDAAMVIADAAQKTLGWDSFALRLCDESLQKSRPVIHIDTFNGERRETPIVDHAVSPLMRKVFEEGPLLILRKTGEEPSSGMVPFGNTDRRSASLLFVPINNGDKVVGILSIQSYAPDAYDQQSLQVLQKLAGHCGGALERIRTQELLRQAHDELEFRVKERTVELLKANTLLHEEIEERKRTETDLAYEQHLLKSLMDNVPDFIYFKDAQGRFTHVNASFATVFAGGKPEDMIGKSDFDYLSEADAKASQADEQHILKTGKPVLAKEEHETWRDGRTWWALSSKVPFRDKQGNIIGTIGITRDITEQKKAEETLQKAQAGLEQLIQERTADLITANKKLMGEIAERRLAETRSAAFSNLGYLLSQTRTREEAARIILDVADQLLGWDSAYLQLYSPDHSKVIPVLSYDLVHGQRAMSRHYLRDDTLSPRDRLIIQEGAQQIFRTAPEEELPAMSPFGDTKRRSLSLMFVPIRSDARVIGVMSVQSYSPQAYDKEDLHVLQSLADFCFGALDRIEAEQALRKSEERFSKAFRSSPVPMSLNTLKEGRFIDVNDSMVRLMGYAREEMIGRTSLELGIWPSAQERENMVALIEKQSAVRDLKLDVKTRSGQFRKTLLSVDLLDFAGEPTLLASAHDITDRLNLEEQLRHSQKMEAIGQLAGGVAHDFNNILTIIQGHISLLASISPLPPDMAESLEQMAMATDRAANLTRQLLTFSRKQIMQLKPMDLNDTIATASNMLQRLLGENISLHFNYSPRLPAVLADSGMIEQILMNLAVNARDAMPDGGKLIISTEKVSLDAARAKKHPDAREGSFVCLTVSDTGCGINPEVLGRVFEPFFTTKEIGKGTGLGLATVYGIVQQHHGWIDVKSQINRGTTFHIFLPAADDPARIDQPEKPVPTRVNGGHETILVVEDEPALRELVTSVLEFYGYRVLEAMHGKEALTVWSRHKDDIDLLLTDIVMPEGLSGLEVAELLKNDRPDLKVIYSSGYSVELFEQKLKLSEGVNFLPKPYQPKTLAQFVRQCLDGRAA